MPKTKTKTEPACSKCGDKGYVEIQNFMLTGFPRGWRCDCAIGVAPPAPSQALRRLDQMKRERHRKIRARKFREERERRATKRQKYWRSRGGL